MAKADDAFAVTKGLVEGHAKGDADVFVGVVVVDFEVALSLDIEIEEAMGGNLMEHVIKKGNAGIGIALSGTVDVEGDGDISFFGGAGDGGSTGGEFDIGGSIVCCLHGDYEM
ncbi:hypothetical protein N836_11635 [Leptolyngbya sp. Heron Island J]|nr:hypothetical protein N836_11635 [Leptolyngbya sp. Heron Island J]